MNDFGESVPTFVLTSAKNEHLTFVSHWERKRERVEGIEPSYAAWKAAVLPLNYTRKMGPKGFEPLAS